MNKEKIAAVILAGGKGSRSLNPLIPKSLQIVFGKPIIQHQIETLFQNGITDITIVGGYLGVQIEQFLKINYLNDTRIKYVFDEKQCGTTNALLVAIKNLDIENLIVIAGDLYFDAKFNFNYKVEFHCNHRADLTFICHPNSHPADSDLIQISLSGRIYKFIPKNTYISESHGNLALTGIFVVNINYVKNLPIVNQEIVRNLFMITSLKKVLYFGCVTLEYIKDLGTPDRLKSVENLPFNLKSNSFLRYSSIFLDLDDTVFKNVEIKNRLSVPKLDFNFIMLIKSFNRYRIPIIVASNQPGIAKGFFTEEDYLDFQHNLEFQMSNFGSYIDAWLICPHHPEVGWPGENPALKIDCGCRKPKPGLLFNAASQFGLDLRSTIYLGNSDRDADSAKSAGVEYLNCEFDYNNNRPNSVINFLENELRLIPNDYK